MLRAIVICPSPRLIIGQQIEPGLEGMYAALREADSAFSGLVEHISLGPNIDLWIDEESNLSEGRPVWELIGGHKFAGAALILCSNAEGESVSCPIPIETVMKTVSWTTLETTGDFTEGREYQDPKYGFVIEGGKPIYREHVAAE